MRIIISYDIIDDAKRTKLAKKLCDYGKRVQYSVFEADLSEDQLKKMIKKILPFIDEEVDSLRIYKLCASCEKQIKSYGIKKGWQEDDVIII